MSYKIKTTNKFKLEICFDEKLISKEQIENIIILIRGVSGWIEL